MTARDRKLLAVLAVAAILGGFWFMILAPKRKEASDLAAKVTAVQQRLDAAQTAATTVAQAKAGFQRDLAAIARTGKAVPSTADEPSLVFQLERAARKAKVDFRSVRVEDAGTPAPGTDAASTTPGITPKPFTLSFEGTYSGLRRFLAVVGGFTRVTGDDVVSHGRLLTLEGVSLAAGRKGLPHVKADITAKAYVADLPPLPGKAPAPGATTPGAATPAPAGAPTNQTAQVQP
jgi:Tfp pilus assembly protein PilO